MKICENNSSVTSRLKNSVLRYCYLFKLCKFAHSISIYMDTSDPEEVKKEGGRGRVVVSKEQGKKEGDFILV